MTLAILIVVLVVFVVSATTPFAIRPALRRLGAIDIPNERSSHTEPALRAVGLAPTLGLLVGAASILLMGEDAVDRAILLACLSVALVAAAVGLIEDVRGIRTRIRASLQVAIGIGGAIAIAAMASDGYLWVPLGAFAVAVYINAANFMDGVDGMSGLHGLVVGSTYAAVGAVIGAPWLVAGGAMLAAAFLGFLPWNVLHGRMFLGDVGSYLLGAGIAALAFGAFIEGVNPVALVAPVSLYLADTGTTVVRRIRRGEPWLEAHRSHIYQRLTDRGLTHLQVATIVALGSLLAGAFGLLSLSGSAPLTAIAVAMTLIIAVAYLRSGDALADRGD